MDVVQMRFRLRLHGFRHRIEHVHGLVEPAALFLRRGEHLAQRGPEPQGTITDGQLGVLFQAAALEIEQHLAPALGTPHGSASVKGTAVTV